MREISLIKSIFGVTRKRSRSLTTIATMQVQQELTVTSSATKGFIFPLSPPWFPPIARWDADLPEKKLPKVDPFADVGVALREKEKRKVGSGGK